MNKKSRLVWFKTKLSHKNLTIKDIATELGITERQVYKLICGEHKNEKFKEWVIKHLGNPIWL
jgi:predicted transcriptional regulator